MREQVSITGYNGETIHVEIIDDWWYNPAFRQCNKNNLKIIVFYCNLLSW